jgi:hypothetical protein
LYGFRQGYEFRCPAEELRGRQIAEKHH